MATARTGKPYIWVTWLAKLLGGHQCVWSAWFKAHYKYDKYEEMAADLVKWNREHNALVAKRVKELEANGWTVMVEDQNAFKLEGEVAVVAGKPDIVATKDGQVLVVDGKTGRERESDIWQVLFYLFAIPKSRPDLKGDLEGEVQYAKGDVRVSLTPADLDEPRMAQLVDLIKAVAGEQPPAKRPSRPECKVCNIGFKDCPQRVGVEQTTAVGEF
jgi:CRISPR/Cas system-associated exonuclease Cas4 (RecB family)